MNYYSFHIGDYAKATNHLDCFEDLFHRRMLDLYYSREQALPADTAAVCRLLRAQAPEHKDAVQSVLAEYFILGETGWTQRRCEEEIASAALKRSAAAESANRRWREERAKGEGARLLPPDPDAGVGVESAPPMRPHDPGDANAIRTHCEGMTDAMPPHCGRTTGALPPHCEGNAPNPTPNPNPVPNPVPNTTPNAGSAATPAVPVPDPPANVGDWLNFFHREGFDPAAIRGSVKLRAALGQWVAQGVGQALLRDAMQIAQSRLGCRPNLPSYYVDIVADLLAAPGHAAPPRAAAPAMARPVIEAL